MKKLFSFLLLVISMTNAYAQSEIKAFGSKPKVGDSIYVVVKNTNGPMKDVQFIVKKRNGKTVESGVSDMRGQFTFKLIERGVVIVASYKGYYTVEENIYNNKYDIFLEKAPEYNVLQYPKTKINTDYPAIIVDEMLWDVTDEEWERIDTTKSVFDKSDIALLLFGKDQKKYEKEIQEVIMHSDDEYTNKLGYVARNGAIEVWIRKKKDSKKQ